MILFLKRLFIKSFVAATVVTLFFLAMPAHALEKSWHAAAAGKSSLPGDFFILSSTGLFKEKTLTTGLYFDYQMSPLTVTRLGTKFDSLPHLMIVEPQFAFAFSDRGAFGVKIPVALIEGFNRIGSIAPGSFKVGVADIEIDFRYLLVPRGETRPGFAVEPFAYVPTGTEFFYLNHNYPAGGVKLVGDWAFSSTWILGLNITATGRPNVTYGDTTWGSDLAAGLAIGTLSTESFSFCFETTVSSSFNNFFKSSNAMALNTLATGKLKIKEDWGVTFSLGSGFFSPVATPILRAVTGVTYTWGIKKPQPPPVPVPEVIPEPPPPPPPPPVPKRVTPPSRQFLPIR